MVLTAFVAGQIAQRAEGGESIRSISRRTGYHRRTISSVLQNPTAHGARRTRVRTVVAQRRQALRRFALLNKVSKCPGSPEVVVSRRYPTAADLAKVMRRRYPRCTAATVHRDLKALGLKFRVRPKVVCNSADNNLQRLRFALANLKTRLNRLVFSDECWVNDNDNTHRREIVDPNDPTSRPSTRQFQKRPSVKVMIWGAIGLNFKSSLIFLDESVTSETYISQILVNVKNELKAVKGLLFMQDNALTSPRSRCSGFPTTASTF